MGFWSGLLGFFEGFFSRVAETMTGKLAESLSDIAVVAVNKLEATDLTNEQKRAQAFEEIKDAAVLEGIEFSVSAINLAIESAVAIMKDEAAG